MVIFKTRIAKIILAFIAIYSLYKAVHAYDKRTDGFSIEKISSDLPYNPNWDIKTSKEDIEGANVALQQPYYYLGRGFQCYAFVSQDGKYVLKFVRHQRLRLSEYAKLLPNIGWIKDWKEAKSVSHKTRTDYLFNGLKVGFEKVPQETALLFVHINRTENKHGSVNIMDKAGNKYNVKLDDVVFVLQRKAMHIEPVIEKLMNEGDLEGAKKRINQIFQLFIDCGKKGVIDTDGALIRKHNLGFLDDKAIYIDTGKLTVRDENKIKGRFAKDLKRLRPFEKWLRNTYPELTQHFLKSKQEAIEQFTP